jgi:succinylglutamic semialdehyde dehydrogenase
MNIAEPHYISGEWAAGRGPVFQSIDPTTGEITWEGAAASDQDVTDAVSSARKAFEPWADLPIAERIEYLHAFRDCLRARKDALTNAISRDVGKPLWESATEVDAMVGKIDISVEAYHDRCRELHADASGADAICRFRPHGVMAVFGPFNLPGHLPNGHIVPALLAGNTVVLKPSEQAPSASHEMLRIWSEVDLPSGVINMVQGGRDTGISLSTHPGIDGLFFTGSAEVGKALHKQFGGRPEKILALEMGGNNPLVVFDVSDVVAAAYTIIVSAYITSGQRCSCARRLIIAAGPEGDTLLAALTEQIRGIRVGPFTDSPEPFMGPVISEEAARLLLEAQADLISRGGRVISEMKPIRGIHALLSPGLMDVTEVADRPDEELFGPFLQVIRVPDFDSALREANNTSFGLAAGILSDNEELYAKFLHRIRAGVVNRNRQTTGASSRLPFGGIGASGNHRPSAYFAADYCSHPVASIEKSTLELPDRGLPGTSIEK